MAAHPSSDRRAHHLLLKLVDNYADEELSRERAIEELKKRRAELASDIESAFDDLERMKENRIAAQEEVRELRIELEAIKAAANFKQAKVSSQQEAISKTSTLLKNLEDEEISSRNTFISTMMEINKIVRKMHSAQRSGPTFQLEDRSFRSKSGILENSEPCCEPNIEKTTRGTFKDGARVRHENDLNELLGKVRSREATLLPFKGNLDCHQEKLLERKQKHAEYIDSIGHATQELKSTRKYPLLKLTNFPSEQVEEQVASLTTDLQDLYVCPQCGTDNLDQATG